MRKQRPASSTNRKASGSTEEDLTIPAAASAFAPGRILAAAVRPLSSIAATLGVASAIVATTPVASAERSLTTITASLGISAAAFVGCLLKCAILVGPVRLVMIAGVVPQSLTSVGMLVILVVPRLIWVVFVRGGLILSVTIPVTGPFGRYFALRRVPL